MELDHPEHHYMNEINLTRVIWMTWMYLGNMDEIYMLWIRFDFMDENNIDNY
jgi:hypothetical protein